MIINQYERPAGRAQPKISDPLLAELDGMLDDPQLLALVRHDLKQHYSRLRRGRPAVPVEVTLRMTVLRRRKRWSYRQAEQEVRDSPPYRWWVRVYDHPVPDHTTLNDWERRIQPKTLHRLNDRLLRLAQDYRLTAGCRLRVDSSVTESTIHYPTDSSLLVDGVRVLSRLLKRAQSLRVTRRLHAALFSGHTRCARRWARRIGQLARPAPSGRKQLGPAEVKKKPCSEPMPS
jgi:transposase, IS5 family